MNSDETETDEDKKLALIEKALLHEPMHSRTSCSDENIANAYTTPGRGNYPRCNRCALLRAKEDDDLLMEIGIELRTEVSIFVPDSW